MPLLDAGHPRGGRRGLRPRRPAACRRAAHRGRPRTAPRLRGAAVATVLFGLLIALAAVQTARNADVREASRDALINRIDERQQEVASLRDRIESLRRQNDDLQSTSSRVQGQLAEATVQLRALQLSTGFVAVHGPGLRITVSDNPDGSSDGRVRATDLRLLVNGLWRAGAEAIAINGRRLSAISRDRELQHLGPGEPLTAHAAVRRLGDRRRQPWPSQLQASTSGAEFQALADQFGFVVDRHNESELAPPGGARHAAAAAVRRAGEPAAPTTRRTARDRRAGARRRASCSGWCCAPTYPWPSTRTCRSRWSRLSTRSSAACVPTSTGSSTTRSS